MKIVKKSIRILLMCCVLAGLLPTTAWAATTGESLAVINSGAAKYDSENGYFVLTPDHTMESSGAIWLSTAVEGDFTLNLEY